MVTARETADSKVIAMEDRAGRTAPPPRTLLEEVNAHLVCALCRGYYIDATTIVECLHSFCRSCIIKHLQVKSYCPVCEMMINSAKPNIKPDKALQDIVYKLVPGLFQKEMRRRQAFYASRPGPAACATPEQRGEDTERIIFSPEDVISFSLEYIDRVEVESASSRSSESGNESAPCNEAGAPTRRYLQCPAVVNISHLKKFLSMKYDIDATHFFLDILYKRVPLPDYYTLMDIAYIYNWKRNEPMRFFYQITDFSVIRDRFGFFGINRPGGHAHHCKSSPSGGDATAPDSPALLTEGSSDCSDGSRSPLPQSSNLLSAKIKSDSIDTKESEFSETASSLSPPEGSNGESSASAQSSLLVDVEKSQFLNSFELTAKSSLGKCSGSPVKEEPTSQATPAVAESISGEVLQLKSPIKVIKPDTATSPGKRKSLPALDDLSDVKKPKLLTDKIVKETMTKVVGKVNTSDTLVKSVADALAENCSPQSSKPHFSLGSSSAGRIPQGELMKNKTTVNSLTNTVVRTIRSEDKTVKPSPTSMSTPASLLKVNLDSVTKKCIPTPNKLSMKRKAPDGLTSQSLPTNQPKSVLPKAEQIVELQPVCKPPIVVPKSSKTSEGTDIPHVKLNTLPPKVLKCENTRKLPETPKEIPKRPDHASPRLPRPPLKLNISKPSKSPGDPLKTLFDSCNINIPSSLSITLTDQKLDQGPAEQSPMENNDLQKTSQSGSKSVANQSNAPSPPVVHNYIEILKLPDLESSKSSDSEKSVKSVVNKPGDSGVGGKGPVPKLKPIGDTKPAKSGSITKPTTFQQTFLQSLQQQCEKPKYLKTRIEYPKINASSSSAPSVPPSTSGTTLPMPTVIPNVASLPLVSSAPTPPAVAAVEQTQEKSLTTIPSLAKSKLIPISQPVRKFCNILPKAVKSDSALDLSTPHATQSQLGPQQTKALETMQSIANLAKKQSFTQRMASPSQVFSQESFKMNTSSATPLRIPVPPPKHLKPTNNSSSLQTISAGSPKHTPDYFLPSKSVNIRSNNSPAALNPKSNPPSTYAQASQRSLTRSPSSSPKLVIACSSPKSQSPERKQLLSPRTVDNGSQSNLISSSQISSTNHAAADVAGGSKEIPKVVKPLKAPVVNKNFNSRGSSSAHRPGTSGYGTQPSEMTAYSEQMSPQQAYILQQLELQTRLGLLPPGAAAQWYNNPAARAHFERIMKNNPQ